MIYHFRDLDSREKFLGVFREQAAALTNEDQFRTKNPFGMTFGELDNMLPIALCDCKICEIGLWCP